MPETGDVVLAPVESVRVGSLESVIAQSVPHQWAGGGDCVGCGLSEASTMCSRAQWH